MRRLIVNADDFGIHPARNRGIAEAVHAGVVTSVSLIANLEGFEDAIELLKTLPRVDVGLHLNLSEGRPLGTGYRTLIAAYGSFLGKREARRRAAAGLFDAADVEAEAAAQIAKLRSVGLEPSHVDGHQHIHVYGPSAVAVARAASKSGVRWTRVPSEPMELSTTLPEERRAKIDEYRAHSEQARGRFVGAGMRSADHFRGLAISGRMTPERLAELVRSLPEGTTEFMVHPGRRCEGPAFDGADREAELAALLSPQFRQALIDGGVELVRRGQCA